MDYNTYVIIATENIIMKINNWKEIAHRMNHSKPKLYSVCPRRLQQTRNDCTVLVQWLSSVNACAAKTYWINDCAETHLFPSQKYKHSIYSMVSTVLTSFNNISGSIS